MGGEGRLIFFFGTVEVGWKKERMFKSEGYTEFGLYSCVDLGEMYIIDRGEGNYSRKKNYFDGVVICVKSANRLFESQPFQLARNITPLFCLKR